MTPQEFEIVEAILPLAFVIFLLTFFGFNNFVRVIALSRRQTVVVFVTLGALCGTAVYLIHHVPSEGMDLGHCSFYTKEPSPADLKVKIITCADFAVVGQGEISSRINRQYASHFDGFAFQRYRGCIPWRRALQWTKIPLLWHELSDPNPPEWVVWIDADAVFVRPDYNLYDRFLRSVPDHIVMLVAEDVESWGRPINTGFMAVRRGAVSLTLLERIWNEGPRLHLRYRWFHEQGTLTWLVDHDEHIRKQVMILKGDDPGVKMYSDGTLPNGPFGKEEHDWRPGHVVAHAIGPKPGGTNKMKALMELEEYVQKQRRKMN